jgi:hypothetical protein
MKLQPKIQWLLLPRPDLAVDRSAGGHFGRAADLNLVTFRPKGSLDQRVPEAIDRILAYADEARKQHRSEEDSESAKLISALSQARTRCYRSFLGRPEREEDDARDIALNQVSWMTLGNMALGAELAELAAFTCLNYGEEDRAKGFFGSAATCYYLTGLWNAGQLNEWASQNIEPLKRHAKDGTLRIPITAGKTA